MEENVIETNKEQTPEEVKQNLENLVSKDLTDPITAVVTVLRNSKTVSIAHLVNNEEDRNNVLEAISKSLEGTEDYNVDNLNNNILHYISGK